MNIDYKTIKPKEIDVQNGDIICGGGDCWLVVNILQTSKFMWVNLGTNIISDKQFDSPLDVYHFLRHIMLTRPVNRLRRESDIQIVKKDKNNLVLDLND